MVTLASTAETTTPCANAGRDEVPVRRFSVDEYHALGELGILTAGAGIELLDGLLVESHSRPRTDDPMIAGQHLPLHRFSLNDYHALRDAGTLDEDAPCEFVEGLLIATMIRRPPHDTALGLLQDELEPHVPAGSILRNQSANTLSDSEPEPDLAIVRGSRRDFARRHPGADETMQVIEIADASLTLDRTLKLKAYAKHSIPHYWIVNLADEQVEVYSDPTGLVAEPKYRNQQTYGDGQSVPLVLNGQPITQIPVADILP